MNTKQNNLNQKYLDLRGTPCPLNFVKCKLAIDSLESNQRLMIDIDKGEPEEMVISSLMQEGYKVSIINDQLQSITILID